jgi:hypothetical protein
MGTSTFSGEYLNHQLLPGGTTTVLGTLPTSGPYSTPPGAPELDYNMGYQDISEVINDAYGSFGYDAETTDQITGYMVYNGTGSAPSSQTFIITPEPSAAAGIFGGTDYKATAVAIVTDETFGLASEATAGPNGAYSDSPVAMTPEFVQISPGANGVASYTINSHLSATVNGGGDHNNDPTADAGEIFTMTPVGISLGGTTKDSSGNQNILIGQQCSASVYGLGSLPAGWNVTNYNWIVGGGNKVSGFYLSPAVWSILGSTPADEQGYPVPVANTTWSSANPTWYWSDNEANWGKR